VILALNAAASHPLASHHEGPRDGGSAAGYR
jgi:hypothetical protein